jgi:hypothetical protein
MQKHTRTTRYGGRALPSDVPPPWVPGVLLATGESGRCSSRQRIGIGRRLGWLLGPSRLVWHDGSMAFQVIIIS